MKQGWHSLILFTLPLCAIGSLTFLDTATAQQVTQQVTPDGTVSTTVTTPDGKNFTINDGTRRGGNLFHSFKEFSVPTGGSANFNNADSVLNIIGRVTGGSVSNIDGAIRALGKANVFLLNPAGIIFGPNASLNIGGSFLGSTANSFIFDNNFEFSATDPKAPPLLTINVPIGLGFRNNPGAIQVRGPVTGSGLVSEVKPGVRGKFDSNVTGLQVEPGKTLALVGGNVFVEGGVLRSEGGRIEIGSFDGNQIVNLIPAQSEGFSLAYQGTPSFRDIQFSGQAFVNVTGDGGGSIAIKGRNINFNSQSVLLADTLADKNGGEISIVGGSIAFNRSNVLSNTFSSGNAGQIKLDANNIKFDNRSGVSIQTWDKGKAGNLNIRANSLEIKGGSAFVGTTTGNSTGNGGEININVNGPMAISTAGIVTDSFGTGNAGKININANSLQIDDSGVLSRAFKTGQGGEININVADSLTTNETGIQTTTYGTADAGKININTNYFQFNGQILSEAGVNSTGRGGEINITAGSLEVLQNPPDIALISTSTFGKGDAGDIKIAVKGPLTVAGGAGITTNSSGTGNAGGVNILARSLSLTNGGKISTSNFGSGAAGNITVTTAKDIQLNNQGSIDAFTAGGQGNISLSFRDLILRNNSNITTVIKGTVNAGNIAIRGNTGLIVLLNNSSIDTSAQQGFKGSISVSGAGIFVSQDSNIGDFNNFQSYVPEVFKSPETVIDPAQQIAQNPCIKGFGSTFTITGRGGLPSDPNKILSSDNVRVDLVEPVPSKVSSTTATEKKPSQQPPVKRIIPAQGWIYNDKGQVVLVGYDPTKTGPQREQPAPTSNCAATR